MGKPREKNDGRGRLGGRVKGTPNKITSEVKNALAPLVTGYINGTLLGSKVKSLAEDLALMTPEDRANIIVKLVPYVMPRLNAVEVKSDIPLKTLQQELDDIENGKD